MLNSLDEIDVEIVCTPYKVYIYFDIVCIQRYNLLTSQTWLWVAVVCVAGLALSLTGSVTASPAPELSPIPTWMCALTPL